MFDMCHNIWRYLIWRYLGMAQRHTKSVISGWGACRWAAAASNTKGSQQGSFERSTWPVMEDSHGDSNPIVIVGKKCCLGRYDMCMIYDIWCVWICIIYIRKKEYMAHFQCARLLAVDANTLPGSRRSNSWPVAASLWVPACRPRDTWQITLDPTPKLPF